MSEWYEDHSNIVTMARAIANGATVSDIIDLIESPSSWTRQWEDLDEHDDEWCNGILECERKECDACHDKVSR